MYKTFLQLSLTGLLLYSFNSYSQTVLPLTNPSEINSTVNIPRCGAYHFMQHIEKKAAGTMDFSDGMMEQLAQIIRNQQQERNFEDLYVIPIVFHVVYNNNEENIHDSVLFNQLEILNDCFRRFNESATDTRTEFLDLVGDSKIQFELAIIDPYGSPTTGITRTFSSIESFGGILPYGQAQTTEIQNWVTDSLFYNLFRLSETNLGGEDAWDTENYLNIWIGDLRIFEPQFNNLEELVYLALATPPIDHVNWPINILDQLEDFEQGILIHYVTVGGNNPNLFPAPYNTSNGVVNTGKMLVHEVGHYLGLRHIWGDGGCTEEDYIDDTPNSNSSSNYTCNHNTNSCPDNINGLDLPDMVENYMDYSSGNCQNSFTIGQSDLMRATLEVYRPDLAGIISTVNSGTRYTFDKIEIYPNPTKGKLTVNLGDSYDFVKISIRNSLGQVFLTKNIQNYSITELDFNAAKGMYFLTVNFDNKEEQVFKIIIE